MSKPYELTATEAIRLIQNRELSISEWVSSCFARIKEKENVVAPYEILHESEQEDLDLDNIIKEKAAHLSFEQLKKLRELMSKLNRGVAKDAAATHKLRERLIDLLNAVQTEN